MNLLWLLLGPGHPREGRWMLYGLGTLLLVMAFLVVGDAPGLVTELSLEAMGYVLVALGLFRLAFAILGTGGGMSVRFGIQGAVFLLLGFGVADFPDASDHAVPWMFVVAFALNGLYQMASALIIRYPHWHWFLASGVAHLVAGACVAFWWQGAMAWLVPLLLGAGLGVLAASAFRLGFRLGRAVLGPGGGTVEERIAYYLTFHLPRRFRRADLPAIWVPDTVASPHGHLLVHIWTPMDVARLERTDPNLITRYLIARDGEGKITVGHAALEMAPDVYISHCDGDPGGYDSTDEAWRELRSQDRPGEFLPSFQEEVAHYLQPSVTLRYRAFRADQLRTFWAAYRQVTAYNLTNRNCSVAVALALEVAVMGSLAGTSRLAAMLRLLLSRDLWVAHFLRWKAREMVWTPGLMLDYALALHRLVEG